MPRALTLLQLVGALTVLYLGLFVGPRRLSLYISWAATDPDFFAIPACIFSSCASFLATCVTNTACSETLDCIRECQLTQPRNKQAMCAYICEVTDGYMNPQFEDLMLCMIRGGCMSNYPKDGECRAADEDTVQTVTSMDQVSGEWWVIAGLNCGVSDDYPGGYDWFPCQHERWTQREDGSWYNSISFCAGKDNSCISRGGGAGIKTIANASLPSPGVIRHEYDSALSPQIEHWRVVSMPSPDYMLVLWCGKIPIQEYNGGLLFSRHRSDRHMSKEVRDKLRGDASRLGVDLDSMCTTNNEWCPNE